MALMKAPKVVTMGLCSMSIKLCTHGSSAGGPVIVFTAYATPKGTVVSHQKVTNYADDKMEITTKENTFCYSKDC